MCFHAWMQYLNLKLKLGRDLNLSEYMITLCPFFQANIHQSIISSVFFILNHYPDLVFLPGAYRFMLWLSILDFYIIVI